MYNIEKENAITKEESIASGKLIKKADKIGLIATARPDGDTIGCTIALYIMLQNIGKECDMICADPVPNDMKFLPHSHKFKRDFRLDDYDLFIITDTADPKLTGFSDSHPELFDKSVNVINIDHHISNINYGIVNIVKPKSATATMVVYKLLKSWNIEITPDIATSLMLGIYTDTGSFMHGNTNEDSLIVASKLLRCGANIKPIVKNIFRSYEYKKLKLWGYVLNRARLNQDNIIISYLKLQDFIELNATKDDVAGAIDFITGVKGSLFSLLLSEEKDKIKGSLRTINNDINLSDIASTFGGGGHPKASGFSIEGSLCVEEKLSMA